MSIASKGGERIRALMAVVALGLAGAGCGSSHNSSVSGVGGAGGSNQPVGDGGINPIDGHMIDRRLQSASDHAGGGAGGRRGAVDRRPGASRWSRSSGLRRRDHDRARFSGPGDAGQPDGSRGDRAARGLEPERRRQRDRIDRDHRRRRVSRRRRRSADHRRRRHLRRRDIARRRSRRRAPGADPEGERHGLRIRQPGHQRRDRRGAGGRRAHHHRAATDRHRQDHDRRRQRCRGRRRRGADDRYLGGRVFWRHRRRLGR